MRSEDGSIIYRCINGESEAFGLLVDKYKEGIYAFIYAKIRNFHEVLAMINTTFQSQKLQAGFTFRIVEGIKRIKIQPTGQAKSLPWGLSLAAGIIATILSLGSHIKPIDFPEFLSGSPLPAESKVLKAGEIPVDVVKIFKTPIISSQQDKGKDGEKLPDPKNAVFLAHQEQGWMERAYRL